MDVMHVENNVYHSLFGTLLNIKGKTKYGITVSYKTFGKLFTPSFLHLFSNVNGLTKNW